MNKKKTTGIIALIAIVLIILIAAGTKKQSPAPEELSADERTEEAACDGSRNSDTSQTEQGVPGAPDNPTDTSAQADKIPADRDTGARSANMR